MRPDEIVELALSNCSVDALTVICQEHSQTNLRWAANTLTTISRLRSKQIPTKLSAPTARARR